MRKKIRIGCIGAGYFAPFHLEAWKRIPEVELVAICDLNIGKAQTLADKHDVKKVYSSHEDMFQTETLDVVDIITPPASHLQLCEAAIENQVHVICQKPLATTFKEAQEIVLRANQRGLRFMVHENWRFQPWYRKIKRLLEEERIGEKIHNLHFLMRMGDGWRADAYVARQPYFRDMPRFLIFETGIHFIDTFRFLLGEVESVFADLKKLNPAIKGEDSGLIIFFFENGTRAVLDANRYNEPNYDNARYTFGQMLVEGNQGSIRLYPDGGITLQALGEAEVDIAYEHGDRNFASDCVYALQQHFTSCFLDDCPFESEGSDYLKNLEVQEAIYRSSQERSRISL